MPSRQGFRGFSLVEIAAVLVVTSLMAAFVLPQMRSKTGFTAVNCYEETREKLDTIKAELLKFARANERFPSPAKRHVDSSMRDYGREATVAADIDTPGTPADYGLSNTQVSIGALPWATLGLSSDYAGDCWGNKYTYKVTTALTKADTAEGYMQDSIYGNISLNKDATTNVGQEMAFVVISHGEDGLGSVKLNHSNAANRGWCTGTELAKQNCLATNNGASPHIAMDAPFNNGKNAGTNYFDDIVVAAEKPKVLYTPNNDVGKVYGWGSNDYNIISSSGTTRYNTPTPIEPPVPSNPRTPTSTGYLTSVSVGMFHVCGVAVNGHAYCWGNNAIRLNTEDVFAANSGKLGRGNPNRQQSSAVSGGKTFSSVIAGRLVTCGVTTTGEGYCWGQQDFGGLGNNEDGPGTIKQSPSKLATSDRFFRIKAGGGATSCGITTNRDAFCWGNGSSGDLGDGVRGSGHKSLVPLRINGLKFLDISLSRSGFVCGIVIANITDTKGDVYCWGNNHGGKQLGRVTYGDQDIPTIIRMNDLPGGIKFTKVVLGGRTNYTVGGADAHTCALADDGRVFCWGNNVRGQLGDDGNTNPGDLMPLELGSRSGTPSTLRFRDIAAGREHTCGITTDNRVFCWGSNEQGQLAKPSGVVTSNTGEANWTQKPTEIDYGAIENFDRTKMIRSIAAAGATTFITVDP